MTFLGDRDGLHSASQIRVYDHEGRLLIDERRETIVEVVDAQARFPFIVRGWPPDIPLVFQIGETSAGFRALSSPASGRILVSRAVAGGSREVLANVLRHELAHVHLYAETRGRILPRWFDEGYATWVQNDLCERRGLLEAALAMGIIGAQGLDRPTLSVDKGDRLSYALYAQAFDSMVRHGGRRRIRRFFRRIRTDGFDAAMKTELQLDIATLEGLWLSELNPPQTAARCL